MQVNFYDLIMKFAGLEWNVYIPDIENKLKMLIHAPVVRVMEE